MTVERHECIHPVLAILFDFSPRGGNYIALTDGYDGRYRGSVGTNSLRTPS